MVSMPFTGDLASRGGDPVVKFRYWVDGIYGKS